MADDQYSKIKEKFAGKWQLDRSENFEEFLKEMGVNMVSRKLVASAKPTCQITVEGGEIIVTMITSMKTREEKFKLGQEFETEAMSEKGKVVATFDGEKIITEPTAGNKKIPKTIRDVVGGEMCLELHAEKVTCKRYFKRV